MRSVLGCLPAMFLLVSAAPQSREAPGAKVASVAPLDAAEQARTIEQLAIALATMYLEPRMGARYAAALRANLARGAYHGVIDERLFADRLTTDLRWVSRDVHLRILPNKVFDHPSEPAAPAKPGFPEGIEEMRMMGRVAYLRFTAFPHDPRTAPAARAFLVANAGHTKAVVIDGRRLPGGGIEVMDALLPLFFSTKAVLATLETRDAGDKERSIRSSGSPSIAWKLQSSARSASL